VVGMLFPHRRDEAWVGRRGLRWSGLGVGAWVAAGYAFYAPPAGYLVVTWLVVAALVGVAHRVGRRRPAAEPGEEAAGKAPRPRRFLLIGVVAWVGVMLIPPLFAEFPGASPTLAWAVTVATAAASVVLVRTWSQSFRAWDDRHRFALAFGMMAPFVLLGPVLAGPVWGTATSAATLWACLRLWRRIKARKSGVETEPAGSAANT